MIAFNKAWDFLKALPEQQMFREARNNRFNAGIEPDNKIQNRDGYNRFSYRPLIDETGARSYGTVHPAIASMLSRGRDKSYNPINLNLNEGEREQERFNEGVYFAPYERGRSIARPPEAGQYNRPSDDEYEDDGYASGVWRPQPSTTKWPSVNEVKVLSPNWPYGDY